MRGVTRARASRVLLRLGKASFYVLMFTIPVSTYWVVVPRNVFGLQPEYSSTIFYAIDVPLIGTVVTWCAANVLDAGRRLRMSALPVTALLLVLVGAALMSIGWSASAPVAATMSLRMVLLLLLFLYVQNEICDYASVGLILGAGASAQAALAIMQFFGQAPLGLPGLGEMPVHAWWPGASVIEMDGVKWLRAYGLSPSPNILGQYLVLGLFSLLGVFAVRRRTRPSTLWILAVAVVASGLVVTFSRTAWLGFGAGMVVLAVLAWCRSAGRSIRRAGLWLFFVTVIVSLAFVIAYPGLFGTRLGVLLDKHEPAVGAPRLEVLNLSHRAAYGDAAWEVVRRHPLTGVGIGNSALAASVLVSPPAGELSMQPAHSVPLLLSAELGPVGGALWFGVWLLVALAVWQNRREVACCRWLAAWSAAAAAVATFSLFDHSLITYQQGGVVLWLVLGLWSGAAASRGITWRWPTIRSIARPSPRRASYRMPATGLIPIAIVAALAGWVVFSFLIRPRGVFFWDPASFAVRGFRLLQFALDGDATGIYTVLREDPLYPPGFPVLLAGYFWLVGASQESARALGMVAFAVSTVLIFWLTGRLTSDDGAGRRSAWVASLLFLSSPTALYHASDVLLEAPGAMFTLAAAAAYGQFARRGRLPLLGIAGILASATFFLKYNYGLTVIIGLWAVTSFRDQEWASRSRQVAVLAVTTLLPVALWLVTDADSLAGFTAFAVNRSSGLGPLENLAFYPLALLTDYFAFWPLGLAAVACAVVFSRSQGHDTEVQYALAMVVIGLTLATLHPFKQARFIYTIAPFIMMLAGAGIVQVWDARWVTVPGRRFAQTMALLAAMATAASLVPRLIDYRLGENEMLGFDPAAQETLAEMLTFIESHTDPSQGVLVNGVFNEFSEPMLRWRWLAEKRTDSARPIGLPYVGPPARSGRAAGDPSVHATEVEARLRAENPAFAVSVMVTPGSRFFSSDYQAWNAWQSAYDKALSESPALCVQHVRWFDRHSVRVKIFCHGSAAECADRRRAEDRTAGSRVDGPYYRPLTAERRLRHAGSPQAQRGEEQ